LDCARGRREVSAKAAPASAELRARAGEGGDQGPRRKLSAAGAMLLATLAAAGSGSVSAQPAGGVAAQIAKLIATDGSLIRGRAREHGAPLALRTVYANHADVPLWSRDGRLTPQAQALLNELQRADAYGLRREDYAAAANDAPVQAAAETAAAGERRWARLDVTLSAAALRFMSDLHYGRVDPAEAGFKLQAEHAPLDLAAALEALARAAEVSAALTQVEPPFFHYKLLKDALARYLSLAREHAELTKLPPAPATLKPGDSYAGAARLRSLLVALGDLPAEAGAPAVSPPTFDALLSSGVSAFQQRHGLTADGAIGKATFAALTTPLARRVRQIDLTLERWRWLPPFQTPPIIVNIPQFRLFAFRTTEDRAADILQMDVIVGRTYPHTQTPVFEGDMRYVVFRPYWDVPYSITRNEMLPRIRANPGYLAAQRLEIVSGQQDASAAVPPTPANIEALAAGKLQLRQLPGEDNALGLVKFMFPNTYNVYLHSTPAHRLFDESVRAFSHGCIRVRDPAALAVQVLRGTPGDWTLGKVEETMNDGNTLRVNLAQPVNVLILYGTALATEAGPILFFNDIYGYDRRLEGELGLAPPR
jgi:L,D-transpeptidase YcbB